MDSSTLLGVLTFNRAGGCRHRFQCHAALEAIAGLAQA